MRKPVRRGIWRLWALLLTMLAVPLCATPNFGCFAAVATSCPNCQELSLEKPPPVAKTTRTVFLLVPGLLGYGWEWNSAQQALKRYPDALVLVYSWDPWASLATSSTRLAEHIDFLQKSLPPAVEELFVIAHSAAGLLLLDAAGRMPAADTVARPTRLISVGAPLAGMGVNPWGGVDNRHTPFPIALGGRFSGWLEPVSSVSVEIYPTTGDDPVMQRSWGHDPGDPRILPRTVKVRKLPRTVGHNDALGWLCEQLVKQKEEAIPAPPEAPAAPSASEAPNPPNLEAPKAEAKDESKDEPKDEPKDAPKSE